MFTKKIVVLVLLTILTTSCSIKGNFKGLYSYYEKTKKEIPNVLIKGEANLNLCESHNQNKVIITNGLMLQKCLKQSPKALVYMWSPLCKAKVCYPLSLVQGYCNTHQLDLYVVAEYYDAMQMGTPQDIQKPILGIDIQYYKSNHTKIYTTKFLQDIGIQNPQMESGQRYFLFENGSFTNAFISMYEIAK